MKKLYVNKSTIDGEGLFVGEPVATGETIAYIRGPIRSFTPKQLRPGDDFVTIHDNWIGIGRYSWIDTGNSPFQHINHSCEPNVAVVTARRVQAIKDIPADSEIFMDYSLTDSGVDEWDLGEPCTCGTPSCRKVITGISKLPLSVFKQHEAHISPAFRKIYKKDNGLK
jgi:hypothetical protein